MDLETLLRTLIEEEGLTEEEAMRVAAARIKAQRSVAIQRQQRGDPLASVQNDGRGVDYGDETPAEAKARWLEQERNDPQGIYSMGGATPGGIFGDGSIPMDDFDPGAVNRNVEAVARVQQLQVQQQMLNVLEEIAAERRQLPEQPKKQLDDRRGGRRRFGKKKR